MFACFLARETVDSIKPRIEIGNYNFRLAPAWVKNNKELVLAAVRWDWHDLRYASEELKNDEEIIRVAISKSAYAVQYASKELREKKELMELAINKNGYMFMFTEGEIKTDITLIKFALSKDESAAIHIPPESMKKQKFVLSILPQLKPKYIPKEFLQKKKFVMKALQLNLDVYFEIPVDCPIKIDKDIRYLCYKIIYDFTEDLNDWEQKSEEDIIDHILKADPQKNYKLFLYIHPWWEFEKRIYFKVNA